MSRTLLFFVFLFFSFMAARTQPFFPFSVAVDSTVNECEPYLTYYWYSGWENQLYTVPTNKYWHIWLVYVTRDDSSQMQQIMAANLSKDSLYYFNFNRKYLVTQSQTAYLSSPKIENFMEKPVAIWAEQMDQQLALKYAVFMDSSWNEPQLIQDSLPTNSRFLFYSRDYLNNNVPFEVGNALFFSNGKDLYQVVMDSSFQFGETQKIFTADSVIKQLDFACDQKGTCWLTFLSHHSLMTLFKTGNSQNWQGPFLLTPVPTDTIQFKINYTYDRMRLAWTDHQVFYSSRFYLKTDSVYVEPLDTIDFRPDFDAFYFTMNTFVYFECAEFPRDTYFSAFKKGDSWYLRKGVGDPLWGTEQYESPWPVKRICMSGNDQDIYVYVWEVKGPNGTDLYGAYDVIPSALEDVHSLHPNQICLLPNYPNPFNAQTTIPFYLPQPGKVSVDLLNIQGQKIQKLFSGSLLAGQHSIHFDGGKLASGVYFIRLQSGKMQQIRKCILLK